MWGPESAQENHNRGAVADPAAMCNSRLPDAEDVGVLLTRGYADAHPGLSASPQSARRHMLRMTSYLVSQFPVLRCRSSVRREDVPSEMANHA